MTEGNFKAEAKYQAEESAQEEIKAQNLLINAEKRKQVEREAQNPKVEVAIGESNNINSEYNEFNINNTEASMVRPMQHYKTIWICCMGRMKRARINFFISRRVKAT